MFRTGDAVGIDKIYLCGFSPTPLDRFGRVRRDMVKSALGAEKTVPWEYIKSASTLINKLKKEGYRIIGVEQDENSVNYRKIKAGNKNAIIMGAEVTGIPKSILKKCDVIAEIPMRGKLARNRLHDDVGKESLNVSVACGVVLFQILKI